MSMNSYRRHAAECLAIADDSVISPQRKAMLIAMAQAWLRLAQEAERDIATDLAYEVPPHREHPVLQQQQIQRETE
jgi:hypothetical protein